MCSAHGHLIDIAIVPHLLWGQHGNGGDQGMRVWIAAARESDDFLKDLYTERSKALNDSEKNSPHGVILSDFCSHFAHFRGAQHLIKLASPPQKSIKSEGLAPGDPPSSHFLRVIIILIIILNITGAFSALA